MKKIFSIVLLASSLYAGLVNGISMVVNNTAITLYDIDQLMTQRSISQNEAVGILIDEALYKEEISRFNITISSDELNGYLNNLAAANNMNVDTFKKAVEERQSYKEFLINTEKRLLNQKLISKIASGKLNRATEDDMKRYYDNNIEQFKADKNSIQVVPFEQVKDKIFNIIMTQREKKYLNEYFETLKITADIRIVR